jgi:hypothetical protein
VALIPLCLENTSKIMKIHGLVLWKSDIEKMSEKYSPDELYIHPVPFSSTEVTSKIYEAFEKNKLS